MTLFISNDLSWRGPIYSGLGVTSKPALFIMKSAPLSAVYHSIRGRTNHLSLYERGYHHQGCLAYSLNPTRWSNSGLTSLFLNQRPVNNGYCPILTRVPQMEWYQFARAEEVVMDLTRTIFGKTIRVEGRHRQASYVRMEMELRLDIPQLNECFYVALA